MADCSKVVEFFSERERMCDSRGMSCSKCSLSSFNNLAGVHCDKFIAHRPNIAVELVQKWSDEHPEPKHKTYADVFLEKFPTATINACAAPGARPYICRQDVFGEQGCCEIGKLNCLACWNEPYKGE